MCVCVCVCMCATAQWPSLYLIHNLNIICDCTFNEFTWDVARIIYIYKCHCIWYHTWMAQHSSTFSIPGTSHLSCISLKTWTISMILAFIFLKLYNLVINNFLQYISYCKTICPGLVHYHFITVCKTTDTQFIYTFGIHGPTMATLRSRHVLLPSPSLQ